MYRSAIEHDIRSRLERLRSGVYRHDRGVGFALVLSVAPFPPVALLGLLLNLYNLRLIHTGRLPRSERRITLISIALAVIFVALGSLAFALLGYFVLHLQLDLGPTIIRRLNWLRQFVPDLSPLHGQQQGIRQI